jgi:hypothetical protein
MNHGVDTMLDVSIQDLPTVHVAYIDYQASSEQGDFHSEIRACFQRVQSWVARLGHDPHSLLNVGVPKHPTLGSVNGHKKSRAVYVRLGMKSL